MFEFELDQDSDFARKLTGSRNIITTILEDWKKQIIKQIKSGNFSSNSNVKDSALTAIWLDAELGKEPIEKKFGESKTPSIIDKDNLVKSIQTKVLSQTRGEIIIDSKYAKEFEKGGTINISKKNPKFEENINKYLKKNEKTLKTEEVKKIKGLKSLSQISVTIPINPFTDYNQSRATSIIKDFLQS